MHLHATHATLAKSFAWKVAVVVNPKLRGDVNLRVVLGHDAASMKGKVCCEAAVTARS